MSSAVITSTTEPDIRFTSKFSAILERIPRTSITSIPFACCGFSCAAKAHVEPKAEKIDI